MSKRSEERERLAKQLAEGKITQEFYNQRMSRMKRTGSGHHARKKETNESISNLENDISNR